MSDMMKKLLDKKKEDKGLMSDEEQSAKLAVLKGLRSKDDSMVNKLKGMKKVSVMSDSSEGLEAGLEKAKEIVDSHPTEIESPEMEHEKMTHDELNDYSEEELDNLLQKLMAKKEELKSSKES